jgi:nicotinamidase-related amidase
MIYRFSAATALLLIDVQRGVDALEHWGGPRGRRNNPQAEANLLLLLEGWRNHKLPVYYTMHDSREQRSPLKLSLPTGEIKTGLEPKSGEIIVRKDVNSGFIGTNLELMFQRKRIHRVLIAGFFTNMCVETTVRMAGNLGFDTYLAADACATTNRIGPDGIDHDPDLVHDMAVASMDGEFCTALKVSDALSLLDHDSENLARRQGNE